MAGDFEGSTYTPVRLALKISNRLDLKPNCGFPYCDDLLLLSTDLKEIEEGRNLIEFSLADSGLKLSAKKTFLHEPGAPFDYLGYRFAEGGLHIGGKSMRTFREWVEKLLPRDRYRDLPNQTTEERRELLRKILVDFNTGKLVENADGALNKHQIPWIRSFPIVSGDRSFREMDRYIKERIRRMVTGKVSPKNREKVPEAWFRELGYKSLTNAYYRITRRRSLAPYYGWRRYFGTNFLDVLEPGEKKGPLSRRWRQFRAKIQFLKQAMRGEGP